MTETNEILNVPALRAHVEQQFAQTFGPDTPRETLDSASKSAAFAAVVTRLVLEVGRGLGMSDEETTASALLVLAQGIYLDLTQPKDSDAE